MSPRRIVVQAGALILFSGRFHTNSALKPAQIAGITRMARADGELRGRRGRARETCGAIALGREAAARLQEFPLGGAAGRDC
jgi:hypothetical protein